MQDNELRWKDLPLEVRKLILKKEKEISKLLKEGKKIPGAIYRQTFTHKNSLFPTLVKRALKKI